MTTTDSNGIVFLQDTDNISPFHTLINGLQTATSTAVEKAGRGPFYAADSTARTALYTAHGASSTSPLWVDMAGVLYRTIDGTTWTNIGNSPWQTWTPTLTNLTVGSGGTSVFRWRSEGTELIRCQMSWKFGGSASMNNPRISLPVTAVTPPGSFSVYGTGSMDPSSVIRPVFVTSANPVGGSPTTQVEIHYLNATPVLADITLSSPTTFAVGQGVQAEFTYHAA